MSPALIFQSMAASSKPCEPGRHHDRVSSHLGPTKGPRTVSIEADWVRL